MSSYTMPSLHSLELELQSYSSLNIAPINPPVSFSRSLPLAPRPATLSNLTINVLGVEGWTVLHEFFVQVLLPLHIGKVILESGESSDIGGPFYPVILHPLPVVSVLELRFRPSKKNWIFHLSRILRWDAETISLTRDGKKGEGIFTYSSRTNGDLLLMERLHRLVFVNYSFKEINSFLTHLDAPLLRQVDLEINAKHILTPKTGSNSIPERARRAYQVVNSLTICDWHLAPKKISLRGFLGTFHNLTLLRLSITLVETSARIEDMGVYLRPIQKPYTCPNLERLVVKILWHPIPSPPDHSIRGALSRALRDSMSTFVDSRFMEEECSPVLAQLLEEMSRADGWGSVVWSSV